jgi:hypothetical protein
MPRSSRDYEVDSSSKCIFHVIVTADHEVRPAYRRMSDFLTELEVGGAFQLENQWLHSAAVLDSPQASKDQGLSKAVPPFRRSVHSRRMGIIKPAASGADIASVLGCVQEEAACNSAAGLDVHSRWRGVACRSPQLARPRWGCLKSNGQKPHPTPGFLHATPFLLRPNSSTKSSSLLLGFFEC